LRNIDDSLAVGDQSLRQLHPDTAGTLDGPRPVRPALRQRQHRAVSGAVIADLERRQLLFMPVEHRHRMTALGRVDPDHHCRHNRLLEV
jgi:hypothetical protein